MTPRPYRAALTRLLTLLAVCTLAVTAAACGSSPSSKRAGETAAYLAAEALDAYKQSNVVEARGTLATPAGLKVRSSVTLQPVIESGTSSEGTITVVGNPSGTKGQHWSGQVRYVIVHDVTWVYGSTAFWHSLFETNGNRCSLEAHQIFPKLVDHWIELISASTDAFNGNTLGLIDPRGFAEEFLHDSVTKLTNAGQHTLNGQQVITLKTSKGAAIDVPAFGSYLPVDVRTVSPAALRGAITYAYPKHATIASPTHFQYLDTVLAPFEKDKGC